MLDASTLWWEQITGPARFVRHIVESLWDLKHVVLICPSDLPWRSQMRSATEKMLLEWGAKSFICQIDCESQCPGCTDPGAFLTERFCARDDYRPTSGLTRAAFMQRFQVLGGRILWIKGIAPAQVRPWYDLCRGYRVFDALDGRIVLEVQQEGAPGRAPAHIERLSFEDHISNYDVLLLNSLLVSELELSSPWKQYIAALCTALCGRDAEASDRLLTHTDFRHDDPISAFIALRQNGRPPLSAASVQQEEARLRACAMNAQIQAVYPIVEQERTRLVQKWHEPIQEALNKSGCLLRGYDGTPKVLENLEIGELHFMLNAYPPMLTLPDSVDCREIALLRKVRNKLAHRVLCSPDELNALFAYSSAQNS